MIYVVEVIPNYPDAILAFAHRSKTAGFKIFLKEMVSVSVINPKISRILFKSKGYEIMP